MRWLVVVAGVVVAVGVIGVSITPWLATRLTNRILADVPGYGSAVAEARVDWGRADLVLSGLVFERPGIAEPFVAVDELRVDPHLWAWLQGERTADVAARGVSIHYVLGPDEERSQTSLDLGWLQRRIERFPVALDRVVVREGTFRYLDRPADVAVQVRWRLDGNNLANRLNRDEPLFGRIALQATVEEHAPLFVQARVDPFAPRYEVDARLDGLRLTSVNDALRAYVRVDAEGGTFSVSSRLEGDEERFSGRAHPEIEDLQLLANEGRDQEPPLRAIWEGLVGVAGKVGEVVTPGRDEIDVSVPFSGELGETPLVVAVAEALPNAWFGALARAVTAGNQSAEQTAEDAAGVGRATRPARD